MWILWKILVAQELWPFLINSYSCHSHGKGDSWLCVYVYMHSRSGTGTVSQYRLCSNNAYLYDIDIISVWWVIMASIMASVIPDGLLKPLIKLEAT